jgi:hypothetical protein
MACRFCWDCVQTKENPFLQPCLCKGSIQNIHLECIQRWRRITDNNEARHMCQLCRSVFIFPTRWGKQINYLTSSPIWYVLEQNIIMLAIAQALHIASTPIIIKDLQENTHISYSSLYYTFESRQRFQIILLELSVPYVLYFLYLFSKITEKRIYLRYLFTNVDMKRFLLCYMLLSIGSFLHSFPFCYLYVALLPQVIRIHEYILLQMNADAEIIRF